MSDTYTLLTLGKSKLQVCTATPNFEQAMRSFIWENKNVSLIR